MCGVTVTTFACGLGVVTLLSASDCEWWLWLFSLPLHHGVLAAVGSERNLEGGGGGSRGPRLSGDRADGTDKTLLCAGV